jgi:hypothetical protein
LRFYKIQPASGKSLYCPHQEYGVLSLLLKQEKIPAPVQALVSAQAVLQAAELFLTAEAERRRAQALQAE